MNKYMYTHTHTNEYMHNYQQEEINMHSDPSLSMGSKTKATFPKENSYIVLAKTPPAPPSYIKQEVCYIGITQESGKLA